MKQDVFKDVMGCKWVLSKKSCQGLDAWFYHFCCNFLRVLTVISGLSRLSKYSLLVDISVPVILLRFLMAQKHERLIVFFPEDTSVKRDWLRCQDETRFLFVNTGGKNFEMGKTMEEKKNGYSVETLLVFDLIYVHKT